MIDVVSGIVRVARSAVVLCLGEDVLIRAVGWIKQHFDDLRTWLVDMERTRSHVAEVIRSDAIHDMVVHGVIPEPQRRLCMYCGRQPQSRRRWLAPVKCADEWVLVRHSSGLPESSGCRGWRQILDAPGGFELRYRQTGGQRAASHRVKRLALNAQ